MAIKYHETKDRPLNALVWYGSGRHSNMLRTPEVSNSQLQLEAGMYLAFEELGGESRD